LIEEAGGKKPIIHAGAFVHPAAVITGDVVVEDGANIWPCAVLRGDIETVTVGRYTSIQDGSVLHTDLGYPTVVGGGCVVGHACILHGCKVGANSLIGMGAILLTGSEVGEGSIVAAGALVPEGKKIPPNCVAMGMPAKVVRNIEAADRERIKETADAYRAIVKKYARGSGGRT